MDLTLSLTHDCNLDCSYCYAGSKRRSVMSKETADQGLRFAFSFAAKDIQLGFFGGEPLLEWDTLTHASKGAEALASEKGVNLKKTLTTNATLLTPEKLEWLRQHDFFLALSIDGNRKMHDATRPYRNGKSSFDACMAGLDESLSVFADMMEVIVVVDPVNVKFLAESVRFLVEEKHVPRVAINPNFYTEWSKNDLAGLDKGFREIGELAIQWHRGGHPPAVNFIDSKIVTRLKNGFECKDRCNFGEREIAVAPSGRLYPCERLIGDDTNHEMCIGTVSEGFDESKRQPILQKRGNVNEECFGCEIRKRCMNWCCCINYALTGAIDTTDGIVCFHERMAVDAADKVGAALFDEGNPAFLARFYGEDFEDLPGGEDL